MNEEYKRLQLLIKEAEDNAPNDDECLYRNSFHISPPTGWLNDPNGLCQMDGEYHLFFQYSPLDARGGMKAWGHYVTKDFINVTYLGAPFVPDKDFDRNGVYSGSSFVDEEGMHIFYTGNVKLPGEYDYTYSGRRADTILVESKDGRTFTDKKVVIDTDEYPDGFSCHIRDPKVWKQGDSYYMVLGARTINDEGRILVYRSSDMLKWTLTEIIGSHEKFGYMWECPDYFALDNMHVISFSPQGLETCELRYQNIYQSGYIIDECNSLDKDFSFSNINDIEESGENAPKRFILDESSFEEWDMGFDFYAPQTFLDENGRRILIGWAGVSDAEYSNLEVETEKRQHCFTVPRLLNIKVGVDGKKKVFQTPISEIENLRIGDGIIIKPKSAFISDTGLMDILCDNLPDVFSVNIGDGVNFSYDGELISLELNNKCGLGRKLRKAKLSIINSIRILVDSSIIEYYINDGEIVFTTRFYKNEQRVKAFFDMDEADITIYQMKSMTMNWSGGLL